MKNIVEVFVFLGCVFSIWISIQVFQSFRVQKYILSEFNSNSFNLPLNIIDAFEIDLPNISATALPLGPLVSKYYTIADDHQKAIKKIRETWDSSPFSGSQEFTLSQIYDKLNIRDSSVYYSRIAFNKLPNAGHFAKYLRDLSFYKDSIEKTHSIFKIVKNKNDIQQWKIYLASLVDEKEIKIDSIESIAIEALTLFNEADDIRILANYILYGKENVEEAILSDAEAKRLFELKDYEGAKFQLEKAIKLYPSEYTYFENLGIVYFELKNYNRALECFSQVLDSFNVKQRAKSEYFKALTLEQIDKQKNILEICKLYNSSSKSNYVPAFRKLAEVCK